MKNRTLSKVLVIAAILIGVCSARSQSVAIEPGIAVGPVHSGMTIQQVATTLGKPDQIIILSDRAARYWGIEHTNPVVDFSSGPPSRLRELQYTNLGFTIISGSSANFKVVRFVAVNAPFSGKTKEGIGIGSSRSDVVKAYGQPVETKRPGLPNFEVLSYNTPKMKFALQDDKVSAITTDFDLK